MQGRPQLEHNVKNFRYNLAQLGLKFKGHERVVYDQSGYTYGKLESKVFVCNDNLECVYENIKFDTLSYIAIEHRLRFDIVSGETVNIRGLMVPSLGDTDKVAPKLLSDLYDLMPDILPELGESIFEDSLNEKQMVDMTLLDKPDMGVIDMASNYNRLFIQRLIEKSLKENGYTRGMPSQSVINDVINMICSDHQRNLFRDWLVELSDKEYIVNGERICKGWDKQPRLRRWFIDTVGAHIPSREFGDPESDMYVEEVTQAWFMGAVARSFGAAKHEVVPVLIGSQGFGKGSILRYTAGKDEFYGATSVPFDKPIDFMESVRGKVIVELEEGISLSTSSNGTAKQFISAEAIQYRKPYAPEPQDNPKHFVMMASTNESEIFNDPTGSRRFYPFKCFFGWHPGQRNIPLNRDSEALQFQVEQLWAEAYYLYTVEGKEQFVSNADMIEDLCTEAQQSVSVEPVGFNMISQWLDDEACGFTKVGSRIDKKLVFRDMMGLDVDLNPLLMEDRVANKYWSEWVSMSSDVWVKIAKRSVRVPDKVNGGSRVSNCVYERRKSPQDAPARVRKNYLVVEKTSDVFVKPPSDEKRIDELMRNLINRYALTSGKVFEVDKSVSQEDYARLIELEYIEPLESGRGYIFNHGPEYDLDAHVKVMNQMNFDKGLVGDAIFK